MFDVPDASVLADVGGGDEHISERHGLVEQQVELRVLFYART